MMLIQDTSQQPVTLQSNLAKLVVWSNLTNSGVWRPTHENYSKVCSTELVFMYILIIFAASIRRPAWHVEVLFCFALSCLGIWSPPPLPFPGVFFVRQYLAKHGVCAQIRANIGLVGIARRDRSRHGACPPPPPARIACFLARARLRSCSGVSVCLAGSQIHRSTPTRSSHGYLE